MHTLNMSLNVNTLVSVVLALQFAVFGWRINREIAVGDAGRRTWFPIPDIINILSMLCVVGFCVVHPLATGQFGPTSRVVLVASSVLIVFHPICMIGHYRLFSTHGRHIYTSRGQDFPYCTNLEALLIVIAVSAAMAAAWLIW